MCLCVSYWRPFVRCFSLTLSQLHYTSKKNLAKWSSPLCVVIGPAVINYFWLILSFLLDCHGPLAMWKSNSVKHEKKITNYVKMKFILYRLNHFKPINILLSNFVFSFFFISFAGNVSFSFLQPTLAPTNFHWRWNQSLCTEQMKVWNWIPNKILMEIKFNIWKFSKRVCMCVHWNGSHCHHFCCWTHFLKNLLFSKSLNTKIEYTIFNWIASHSKRILSISIFVVFSFSHGEIIKIQQQFVLDQ